MITITSLHEALLVCYKSLSVTTPARIRGYGEHCDHDDHASRLSRQSCTPSFAATTYVVSRDDHVRRSLEVITYVVVSQGIPTRRFGSNSHLKRG